MIPCIRRKGAADPSPYWKTMNQVVSLKAAGMAVMPAPRGGVPPEFAPDTRGGFAANHDGGGDGGGGGGGGGVAGGWKDEGWNTGAGRTTMMQVVSPPESDGGGGGGRRMGGGGGDEVHGGERSDVHRPADVHESQKKESASLSSSPARGTRNFASPPGIASPSASPKKSSEGGVAALLGSSGQEGASPSRVLGSTGYLSGVGGPGEGAYDEGAYDEAYSDGDLKREFRRVMASLERGKSGGKGTGGGGGKG